MSHLRSVSTNYRWFTPADATWDRKISQLNSALIPDQQYHFFIWDTNWPSTFIKGTFLYPLLWSAILAINQMSTGVNLFLDPIFSSICLSSQNVTCYNYSIFNSWFLVVEATKFILLSDCLGNFDSLNFHIIVESVCVEVSHIFIELFPIWFFM